DCRNLDGSIDLVGSQGEVFGAEEGTRVLAERPLRADLAPDPQMPADSRLWAALQHVSGGTWGGGVFDVDAILKALGSAGCWPADGLRREVLHPDVPFQPLQ